MTTRISLTTSLGVRNSLAKFRKAAVCPVVLHLAVLRAKRMKGSFLATSHACLGRELPSVVSDPYSFVQLD
ncbi:hypothetical protein TNCV_3125461 [Trichonephila clavipes]|nr:hypothetical protein TNCV_3125461 [Trichonephila clavipes]